MCSAGFRRPVDGILYTEYVFSFSVSTSLCCWKNGIIQYRWAPGAVSTDSPRAGVYCSSENRSSAKLCVLGAQFQFVEYL